MAPSTATVSPIAGYFQHSTDLSYSNNTSGNQFYGNNNYYSTQSFSATISNLAPNTTCIITASSLSARARRFGINTSFTTTAGGQLPTAVTDGATNATLISGYTYSAMFLATVNPNGADTTVYFAYGTSTLTSSQTRRRHTTLAPEPTRQTTTIASLT